MKVSLQLHEWKETCYKSSLETAPLDQYFNKKHKTQMWLYLLILVNNVVLFIVGILFWN